MTEHKLDIFQVLGAIDKRQVGFYQTLSEEEQKAFSPFIAQRWLSGTSVPAQIILLNEFSNPYMFTLQQHKQLLWQLLTVSVTGKPQRYVWNKLPSKLETGRPNAVKAVKQYFGYSTREAVDALSVLSRSQVLEIAEDLGWQQDDISKIRREIKASTEDLPKKKQKPSAIEEMMEF